MSSQVNRMYATTPFQFLPPHIAQSIVNYIVGSTRVCFNVDYPDPKISKRHEKLLIPLLWVCHSFRNIVHSRFFRKCKLDLRTLIDGAEEACITWPSSPRVPTYPTHHLAKSLKIELDAEKVYSGEVLQMLSVWPYQGLTFPLVRKLSVVICYHRHCAKCHNVDDSCSCDTGYTIGDVVRRVKQMAPAVRLVFISTRDVHSRRPRFGQSCFSNRFPRLVEIADSTVFNYPHGEIGGYINKHHMCDLVRLTSTIDYWVVEILTLTRRNAQTLLYLNIRSISGADITGLIQDPDSGEYVEYPRLRYMKMYMGEELFASGRSIFSGAVPFPCLQRLYLQLCYPFDDDVIFRGNAATLEYLSLAPFPKTVGILSDHGVFTPTSHRKLQCVNIIPLSYNAVRAFASIVEYMQVVMRIAPSASVRQINGYRYRPGDVTPALLVLSNYTCIQVLSLPSATISLWNALTLIRSLPLLSDLTTDAPNLGEYPHGVSTAELPEHMRSSYLSMGKQFRRWNIDIWNHDVAEVASVMLLLALVCPNFNYTSENIGRHERLARAMKEKIDEPEFKKYASRFQHLLHD